MQVSKKGSTPTTWARSLRDQIQNGRSDPENPLFLGFSVLRGGLRPWSQTMVSEGARPWGRGRSGDCEQERKSAKARKRAQKGTKERKRALLRKNCKQPGLEQPSFGNSQASWMNLSWWEFRAHEKVFGPQPALGLLHPCPGPQNKKKISEMHSKLWEVFFLLLASDFPQLCW